MCSTHIRFPLTNIPNMKINWGISRDILMTLLINIYSDPSEHERKDEMYIL